jgi:hypothetical protein
MTHVSQRAPATLSLLALVRLIRDVESVCPVPSLMRSLGLVFGAGMAVGIGGLLAMPAQLEEPKPLFARARDEAPPACASQTWPMAERHCQGWTAARPKGPDTPKAKVAPVTAQVSAQVATHVSAQVPAQVITQPAKPATPDQQPAAREPAVATPAASTTVSSQPTPVQANGDRAQMNRKAQSPRQPIAVTYHAADRSRRTVTITPTTQQDAYYYAARRNVGIGATAW